MRRYLPLLFLLCTIAPLLLGCGGRPSGFTPNGMVNANSPTPSSTPDPPPAQPSASAQPAAPAPAAQSSALPSPPANAVVFDQIQNTTDDWKACSICAQGTNDTTNYWMAPNQTSPAMTGSSRELYIGGPKWSNALFIKTYYDHLDSTHFLWDFHVYWDPTSMANIWTAEFDFWQAVGGKEFMIGSQCNFGDGWWDIWDSKNNAWLHSEIPCRRMTPNQWHRIQWYMERDGSQYRYVTLVVDGKAYNFNRSFDVVPVNWQDSMGVQWQLDQSDSGVDLHEWVDNVKLTAW